MAKFISLKNRQNRTVLINLELVELIRDDEGRSIIQYQSGAVQQINEPVSSIQEKING